MSSSSLRSGFGSPVACCLRHPLVPENCGEYAIYRALSYLAECFILLLEGALQPKLRDFRGALWGATWLVFDWRCIDQPGSPDPGNDHTEIFRNMLTGTPIGKSVPLQ